MLEGGTESSCSLMAKNQQHQQQLVPRDFLGLGMMDTCKDPTARMLGPFQIPDGEVSLAKLQQMSEQTGFQLASAFSAPRYNGFHNGKPTTAAAAAAAASVNPARGFLNGGYRAAAVAAAATAAGYFPTDEQREAALQFLRSSAAVKEMSRARDAADVQLVSREECRKYLKDNRGMKWPVWNKGAAPEDPSRSSKNTSPHFQLAQAQEALNLWNAANHVPTRSPPPATTATTTLSLGQPGLPEDLKNSTRQQQQQQQQQPSAQLTIFYAGSVNVFDNITSDRAKAVMLLAGSLAPGAKSWASTAENASALRALLTATAAASKPPPPPAVAPAAPPSLPLPLPPSSSAAASPPQSIQLSQSSQTTPTSSASTVQMCNAVSLKALPQARKASLARFLERRKERCISKASATDTSSTAKAETGTEQSCEATAAQARDVDADSNQTKVKEQQSASLETANTADVVTC